MAKKQKQIKIAKLVEGENITITKIENTLEAKQEIVGGYIEHLQLTPNIGIILHDEGKLINLPPTLLLLDKNQEILDYIAGTCFFIGLEPNNEDFVSLTDESIEFLKRNIVKMVKLDKVTKQPIGEIFTYNWQ